MLEWKTVPGHHRSDVAAFDELHSDVCERLNAADVVDRDDVWMVQGGCCARLLLEPPQRINGRCLRRQNLQRNVAIQTGVAGAIDLTHTSRPERREDFIRPDANSGFQ